MLDDLSRLLMQFTGGAFAGVCAYILLVQHPVRMARPVASALDDFRAAIPRAELIQAPLLVVCLLATVLQLIVSFGWGVAVGGLLLFAVLVGTVVAVLPINRRLVAGEAADHLAEAGPALTRWGRLHAVRTLVAVGGAVALWS